MMLGMQRQTTSVLCFYDGRIGPSQYGGLFNPSTWEPYLAYYAMMMFNHAYRLGNEVETASDTDGVYTLGATKNGKSVLLIANISGAEQRAELALRGVDLKNAAVTRIDTRNPFRATGESLAAGTLTLPANSCVEIAFDA